MPILMEEKDTVTNGIVNPQPVGLVRNPVGLPERFCIDGKPGSLRSTVNLLDSTSVCRFGRAAAREPDLVVRSGCMSLRGDPMR